MCVEFQFGDADYQPGVRREPGTRANSSSLDGSSGKNFGSEEAAADSKTKG